MACERGDRATVRSLLGWWLTVRSQLDNTPFEATQLVFARRILCD